MHLRIYTKTASHKPQLLFTGMIAALAALCAFSRANSLLAMPLITPEAFLSGMPYVNLSIFGHDLILIQPSSTFFVYMLGLLIIAVGISFLFPGTTQRSRYYWGIGMILWGVGAVAAGTSYQAFGYELKCRGLAYCQFTSSFELAYLLLTAYSINFLVAATAYTSLSQRNRKKLIQFAAGDSVAYTLFLLIGAAAPVKFLISYEGFMAFVGVNFLLMFILNVMHYIRYKDILNRNFILVWLVFLLANIGYFGFLLGNVGKSLYQNFGIWFNENDALHILLILWAGMIAGILRKSMQDIQHG